MILYWYFARRFAFLLVGIWCIFFVMLALIDLIEQSRRFGAEVEGFGQLLQLTLLSMPKSIYDILPLIVIIATLSLFLGLARSSELVVTRAAGRSALRALLPPVTVALLFGLASIAVMNPIVAATSQEYEARVADLRGDASVLALSSDGVWLRQGTGEGQTVIRALQANLDGTALRQVTFLTFGREGTPIRRIEADQAVLEGAAWRITDAKVWPLDSAANPEAAALQHPTFEIPSNLTADQIRNSFGTPSSIPIWDLPQFIQRLQAAGFTARRHQVFLQTELALPLFLVAMVLIAAAFTLRHQRGGRTGVMVLAAVMLSFAVYFLRNLAMIMGENGQIPAMLAAWAPPFAAIAVAMGLLLHLEDG